MRAFTKLLAFFAVVYLTILFVVISAPKRELNVQNVAEFDPSKTFLPISDDVNADDTIQDEYESQAELTEIYDITVESEDLSPVEVEIVLEPKEVKTVKVEKNYNPFTLLGAYQDPNPYLNRIAYNTPHFGFINDDEYCNKVDQYNLEHPENMLEKMNVYSDVGKWGVVKRRVISQIGGTLLMKDHQRRMPKELWNSRTVEIDKEITDFHISDYNFFKYHQIGKHYLCATQMYNHIPNHTDLVRKEYFPQRVQDYSLKYKNQPQCFDKHTLYPTTYRLFLKEECEEFFEIMNSEKYKESLKTEPIQYVVKNGNDVHVAQGVFLLDREQAKSLHSQYESGKKCGQVNNPMITQKYITNPMLLHNDNKFHIRVYVLIASTNPLILYYHDGYLRASAFRFDKFSEDRATHLTNLLTGTKVADALNKTNATNGMSAKQIEDFYIWSFEQLEDYVLETGRTNDTNWLDNHLRPAIQKAFVQVVRMTGSSFWNQSNVYELLGCDFMLDEDMNAWFLEANPDPLLDGVQPDMITKMLKDLFEIEYGYYRSRMKRVLDVIKRMQKENEEDEIKDLDKWKDLYQEAVKNRLEPEYKLNETNTFKLIMDESLPGAEAYFGFLPEECVNA